MQLISNKQERIRFLKFSFVGVTGTIVDFGIMNLANLVFHLPLVWAQAISFFAGVINNFLWNRYWTYPESRSQNVKRQLAKFFLINIVGILVRTPLISWLNILILRLLERVDITLSVEIFILSQNLALTISIAVVLFWNFFANRLWTYRDIPIGKDNQQQNLTKTTNTDHHEMD
ncbi:MAG TPA: GtrA family protein [Brevefilum sp.]|mgnify:FL=1|nr:GtrA family protein [Brevefilum sp.]HOR18285.1 GtrA family protein [Brevefilum sp.]